MIRIGIAEDQALVRESLAIVLNLEADVQVAWTAENGGQAIERVDHDCPDVMLVDLRMPGIDGVALMQMVHAKYPQVQLIVLTTFYHDEWMIDALRVGAVAFFLKEVPPHLLINAIRHIVNGTWDLQTWTPEWRKYAPEIQLQMQGRKIDSQGDILTSRELSILRAICQGRTNTEIAKRLHLTEGTVKNYVSTLYSKLGARHRAEAIAIARERGFC